MLSSSEKFRLGVFLVTAATLLLGTVVLLAGFQLTQSNDLYTIRFDESVKGLEVGAQVKYNGVRVGQITDIEIDKDNNSLVKATVELREGTPVKEDTTAVMVAMGITGLKFVELTGDSARAKRLKPGQEIKAGQSFIGTLEGKAQDIAVKTELAITQINMLLSDKNVKEISEIITNINDISGSLATFLEENDENLDKTVTRITHASRDLQEGMASANRSIQRFEGIVESADPKIDAILDNIDDTTKSFKKAGKSLARVDRILKRHRRNP